MQVGAVQINGSRDESIVMVMRVEIVGELELSDIRCAHCAMTGGPDPGERRGQDADQHRDDRDRREEFKQCKTASSRCCLTNRC